MNNIEAIKVIEDNYSPEKDTILKEALDKAIALLELHACSLYTGNKGVCCGIGCKGRECRYFRR
jgi:hypothetical protein